MHRLVDGHTLVFSRTVEHDAQLSWLLGAKHSVMRDIPCHTFNTYVVGRSFSITCVYVGLHIFSVADTELLVLDHPCV